MKRVVGFLAFVLTLGAAFEGCHLVTGTIACRRDRDCPDLVDGGEAFCTSWDAGIGHCVGDPDFDGDFLSDPIDASVVLPDTDGGVDGGTGGFPALP